MDKELDTWKNGDKGPETGTSKIADCATKFQKLNEDHKQHNSTFSLLGTVIARSAASFKFET